ncbi:TraR/DksA family transcriptional regulator [Halodurantibacterium flavum]|uniref:TraR/DksA family transcriptional regulator n=1 Tax=Halodurantibacterium flavum TaxID=1382802 RepID=A0ABW4S8D8_9RHOB
MATPLERRRAQLEQRLQELGLRLERIEEELDSHDSRDWPELATEREPDEVLEQMGSAGLREMRMIEAALQRIEAGDYGRCQRCGAAIAEERLDLLPFTPFCQRCAS